MKTTYYCNACGSLLTLRQVDTHPTRPEEVEVTLHPCKKCLEIAEEEARDAMGEALYND